MSCTNLKLESISGLGKKRIEKLGKLGIYSVGDLLEFYPRFYEDWSKCYTVSQAPLGVNCCVKAYISTEIYEARIRKGLTLYKFKVTDGNFDMQITLFNQKYAANQLVRGREYLFFGKVSGTLFRKEMSSPAIEQAGSEKIRPIYSATEGLTSKNIEKYVADALEKVSENLYDPLPEDLRKKHSLCHKRYALQNIHFPESDEALAVAKKRLVFEELLTLQLGLFKLRNSNNKAYTTPIPKDFTDEFISRLPFKLTGAQTRAIKVAVADMKSTTPMSRLLQGDVGSGKTAVAAALLYSCAKNKFQSAFMAPTEILAQQHYSSLKKMMASTDISLALLTGSTPQKERNEILEALKSGQIDILIGTHALIQKGVEFRKLGLVITDEQHRFGVAQRSTLSKKGDNPHTLVMSATPIPRTLALVIYGDLDVSVLDEMPSGRKPIETYSVTSDLRKRAYTYVKKHLDKGLQGYIVCPMVEEGELALASAVEFYEKLKGGFFKNYTLGLINGKMKSSEKEKVMKEFKQGQIQLLIATTVIEVGVDVPNANIMVIENAERFGLSQLHQLRGRIGRGSEQATCILISDAQNDEAKRRLSVMAKTNDGFLVADEDLKLRGPGDFFGSKQHGLPTLKIASIFADRQVLSLTSKQAKMILSDDPLLESKKNSGLKQAVDKLFSSAFSGGYN